MIAKFIERVGVASLLGALISGLLLVTLSACEQSGPAEKAGAKMDSAIEKTGEKIESAGDSIRDATKPGS